MTEFERLQKALQFQEADRVPLDLCGTTVTAFSKYAYEAAMKYKSLPPLYDDKLIDPIQQIIIPEKQMLDYLNIDTYRIGGPEDYGF